ncbi:MAG: hypothetical protein JXB39_13350 [Deltaproteobacteria bacterium]|nr:hypothetical protein [Deltaproteobacteria bacterium]
MNPLLFVLLLLFDPAVAADPDHAVDQARHFLQKGWVKDARAELERVAATPEGYGSFEVHWLLSQVAWDLDDPEAALDHARLALERAETVEEAEPARAFVEFCVSTFGVLEIAGPHTGLSSRLAIEPPSTIIDPSLKRYVNRLGLRLKHGATLPVRICLPAGTWTVNGREVRVKPTETSQLELPLSALGARGLAALQVVRIEASSGFGVWFGDRVANFHPGLETQVALTVPVKRALVGLTVDRSFRTYDVGSWGTAGSPEAWTFGGRVGVEWFGGGALAVRPSIGYRYGWLPGIAFACEETGEGLTCAAPGEAISDATAYAVAPVHVPSLEVAADWREGGRITALGIGVRVAVDQAFGQMPTTLDGDWTNGSQVPLRISEKGFGATGVRILAHLSFAL